MDENDDILLKAEIDSIMERVNQIMQDVKELDPAPKETTEKAEE